MSTEQSQIDVSTAPPPSMPDTPAADSSPALGASGASETQPTGDVIAAGEQSQQTQETDIFTGIPSIEELTQQVEQRVPLSEGLLNLRAELERIKPEYDTLSKYKALTELGEPSDLQSAYDLRSKLFSPVINPDTQQPEYDERGLQRRTSQPWLQSMEEETPGFVPRHLNDVLSYEYTDPATGKTDTLLRYHFRSLGLDPDRYDDYVNLDSLLAKNNGGAVTSEEIEAIEESDRAAYRTLPASLRRAWSEVDDDEKRFHLDGAKERLEARQWREQQDQQQQQAAEQHRQQFQAKLRQDIHADLSTLRKEGLTSLRDSLTKAVKLSGQEAVNEDYVDAVITPFALLLTEDFRELGEHMLERVGVKLDRLFYEDVAALTVAREQYKIAEAYGEEADMKDHLKVANGKLAKIMAKFNDIGLKRAKSFGTQASQIATDNGTALAAASNARPMSGNGSAVDKVAGILPAGLDPYSPEANTYLWNQQRQRGQ